MGRMQAVHSRDPAGSEPVNAFIDCLDERAQDRLDWHIDLLDALDVHDPPLAFPHSSQVQGDLRELRCHYGRRLFRILYRRSERTGEVPTSEIALAEKRWDDSKAGMDCRLRDGLRPLGRDAP